MPRPVNRPIFIVGMGRSGTTLLGQVLATHPSVGFLNEPKAVWHTIRGDEDVIGSYAPSNPGRLYLSSDDATPEAQQAARALFSWYCALTRSERIVDKYPELIFRHHFVRAIFPDALFLVATRNAASTLRSVAHWSQTHGDDAADWWGLHDRKWSTLWQQGVVDRPENSDLTVLDLGSSHDHYLRAAVEWVITMREAVSLASADQLTQIVDYDEVTAHPAKAIGRILAFCGLPPSRRTETYAQKVVSPHPLSQRGAAHEVSPPHLPDTLRSAIDNTWTTLTSLTV